jgi:hypothetical protein
MNWDLFIEKITSQRVEKASEHSEDVDVFQDPKMADNPSEAPSRDSKLYHEFLAERDEILRQKWLKSEEAGTDIGLDRVLVEWAAQARSDWKKEYLKKMKS